MSKKNHPAGPVPPGNRPQSGPAYNPTDDAAEPTGGGDEFNNQDEKKRLGGYTTAGEHSRVQPGALNDGDTKSK